VAVATVDIQVNSQGAVSSIRNVNAAATQLERQVNNTNRSVKQLETAFAGLGVAVAGINALNIAKDFFATANAADTAQRRIKMVSTGLDDYRLVLQTARNASAKFGLSQTEAANAVADIYTRLRPVGFGLSEINAIYEGFNTAVKLSSVEAGAASSAFLQLSQGLGSGTLQGDELRSVLEQMPSIAQAIAREMNVTVGSIKKLGSEGKITSEVMVRALDRIRTEGADKLAVAMDTPQQKIVALNNAMEDFKIAVTSDVAPAVIGAIGQITVAVQNATQFVTDLKTGFGLLAGAFDGVASGISGINIALSGTIGKFAALGQSKGLMMLLNFMTLGGTGALGQLAGAGAKKNASKPFAAPIGLEMPIRLSMQGLDLGGGATGKKGRKGKSDAERAAEKAAEEALRLKNSLGDLAIQRDLKQQIYGIDNRIFEANLVNDRQTAIRLEGQKKLAQISAEISKLEYEKLKPQELQAKKQILLQDAVIAQRDTQQQLILNQVQVAKQAEAAIRPIIQEGELLKAKLAGTEQQYQKELLIQQILLGNPTLRRAEVEAIVAKNEALAKQLKQAEELNTIYNQIGTSITTGVLDSITAAVEGTKSLGESASQVLKDIGKQLLRSGIMQLLTSLAGNDGVGFFSFLTGGLGKRAMGGPVSAGSSYMVGERGPELFTPKHGGSIVPNNALGGGSTSVVVNVDASGNSNVQGDQAQAKQLGVAVSAAVQAELVKQQRPGGLLSGTRR
jgi:tape measure domain-containing protein